MEDIYHNLLSLWWMIVNYLPRVFIRWNDIKDETGKQVVQWQFIQTAVAFTQKELTLLFWMQYHIRKSWSSYNFLDLVTMASFKWNVNWNFYSLFFLRFLLNIYVRLWGKGGVGHQIFVFVSNGPV